ncbi:MAG: hypothetical protein FWC28_04240 [Proteobacteria bacterium]|jgi:hypothetical protein|nr:hypothetical protein [Cystobacterineae bacterium]MCL2259198.1 hypothetical protein [Cystobacterineae bacterium]MCL2314447.1 hypothetical protein [Pseudomonadota bacterium]
MRLDKKGTKILARSFFAQLREGGYTQHQVLDIASELLALVAVEAQKRPPQEASPSQTPPFSSS